MEEKTKQKEKGKNTCPKERMENHVSSGEGRRTEKEVRRTVGIRRGRERILV